MATRGRPRSFDRDLALQRSMKLFWERGYEAVSLAELTHELGINKPSLYAAFGSKEGLFREAVELYSRTEGNAAQRALQDEPSARAAIESMLRVNARAYTAPGRPRGCMVVLAANVGSLENQAVRGFLSAIRKHSRELVVKRVQRGMREGDVVNSADPQRIALFYSTVLTGLSVHARDGASAASLSRIIDDAMAAWDVIAGSPVTPVA